MTDYKNELEQILNRLMISANNHRGNVFLLNSDHRKALSSLEALLSQHSKKRELEVLQKLKLDNNGYGGDSAYHNAPFYVVPLSDIDDRINKLGGQDE